MLAKSYASAVQGVDAQTIEIEVNAGGVVTAGKPGYFLVGLPERAIKGLSLQLKIQDIKYPD